MQLDATPAEPGALGEGLPTALNDLIMSLLAQRPDDRPADAAAVHDALTTLLMDRATRLPEGTAEVLDFGIATFLGGTMIIHALTATGAVSGSPPYMSQEQAEGVRVP
ncbi:hypothetical protein [Streptomyces sp. IBSBF 2435]|uniref:hypothetical protein n=1 Tax=Streptomyces sp. IBSBF 2435 TaxID=2903531 RepID=UPI002FDB9FD1